MSKQQGQLRGACVPVLVVDGLPSCPAPLQAGVTIGVRTRCDEETGLACDLVRSGHDRMTRLELPREDMMRRIACRNATSGVERFAFLGLGSTTRGCR